MGHRLLHLTEIDSTMSEAARQAASGVSGPLWILADQQSQGRGRHGRNWASPAGNLHATLLLTSAIPAQLAAEIGFVAGLALHDAVANTTGLAWPLLALKWPNDLLIARAKCAGLLLEGASQGGHFNLSIGFGINLATAPENAPYPATSLGTHMGSIGCEHVFTALANCFAARLSLWHEGHSHGSGFAAIRDEWRERAAFRGEAVTLRLPNGPVTGKFEDIDAAGRIVILTGDGRRVIDAGDLFFGETQA